MQVDDELDWKRWPDLFSVSSLNIELKDYDTAVGIEWIAEKSPCLEFVSIKGNVTIEQLKKMVRHWRAIKTIEIIIDNADEVSSPTNLDHLIDTLAVYCSLLEEFCYHQFSPDWKQSDLYVTLKDSQDLFREKNKSLGRLEFE